MAARSISNTNPFFPVDYRSIDPPESDLQSFASWSLLAFTADEGAGGTAALLEAPERAQSFDLKSTNPDGNKQSSSSHTIAGKKLGQNTESIACIGY